MGVFGQVLNIDMRITGGKIIEKQVDRLIQRFQMLDSTLVRVRHGFKSLTQAQLEGHSKVLKMVNAKGHSWTKLDEQNRTALDSMFKGTEKVTGGLKSMRGGMMGIGFAALFMGMAMNRAIGGFLRSAFDAFKMVGTENSIFAQKTNELAAAWAFFKFSLVDALSQSSLFLTLIDIVINLVARLGELSVGEKTFIAMGLAAGFVLTKLISWGGQVGLLLSSFVALGVSMATLGVIALIVFGIIGLIGLSMKALKDNPKEAEKIWKFWQDNVVSRFKLLIEQIDELVRVIFPDWVGIWEFLSTAMIFGIKVIVIAIGKMVDSLIITINFLEIIALVIKSVALAATGQWTKAADAIGGVKDAFLDGVDAAKSLLDVGRDIDLLFGELQPKLAPTITASGEAVFPGFAQGTSIAESQSENNANAIKDAMLDPTFIESWGTAAGTALGNQVNQGNSSFLTTTGFIAPEV